MALHKISAKDLNQPESFGRPRSDRWNCDMREICEIGLMAIKPGVVGDFKLKIVFTQYSVFLYHNSDRTRFFFFRKCID